MGSEMCIRDSPSPSRRWLLWPLAASDRVLDSCTNLKIIFPEKNEKSAPPKTHHEIHSSPATATNSRRLATKHVPRVIPYSAASIDPGFVEIGLVQLSKSLKTTKCYTHMHTQRQTNYIMAPCTHPGMKRLFCIKTKNGLGLFAPSALPH